VVFGPKPRDYSYHMPKKARRQALCSAVLGKLRDGEVALIDGAGLDAPKTKAFAQAFSTLGIDGSAIVVLPREAEVLRKSARNLAQTRVKAAGDLNAYDVVRHQRLILTQDALDRLVERVGHGRD
jgi:large subunit ribosomal protein L4